MSPFASEVERVLAGTGMLPRGSGVMVAVSGGRDSMVLLAVLASLQERHAWRLAVAHFHHGLRGAEADADRDLVVEEARARGLEVVLGREEVAAAVRAGESLQTAARRLRHRFLAAAARARGSEWIATGHHRGDQTELFLMRLLRGAGGRGLGGMRPVDVSPADPGLRIARPLLGFAGDWLTAAAAALGVRWREDASNEDPGYLRNRVRHELVPLLTAQFQPALDEVLERGRVLLRDEAEAVIQWAAAWRAGGGPGAPAGFDDLPAAVQREVLRLQLHSLGVTPCFDWIEELRNNPGRPVQVGPDRRVVRDLMGRVDLGQEPGKVGGFRSDELRLVVGPDGCEADFAGGRIEGRIEVSEGVGRPPGRAGEERFDADAIGPLVRLRHWRPGDRFQPIGLGTEARLQDLFTNARVPAGERRRRVLAETAEGRLFWVEGLRIGEVARCTEATTRRLVWRWQPGGAGPPVD